MPQLALVGLSTVGGGPGAVGTGLITGPGAVSTLGDGFTVSTLFDAVAAHGPGAHAFGVIQTGSKHTFGNNGLPVVRVGDTTSCGCTVLLGDYDAFCET